MPGEVVQIPLHGALAQLESDKAPRHDPFLPALSPIDYKFIAILSLLLIPAYILAHLPFRVDFAGFIDAYWIATSARSGLVAVLLFMAGFPLERTLQPALRRYRQQKLRIGIALAVTVWLCWLLGFRLGLTITVDALALAELMERRREAFERTLLDLFWPGLYLFCGIVVIFALNSAVVGIRWAGTYDQMFKHLDWVLFHVNVSNIAHWTLNHSPRWFPQLLEFAYFGLYAQLGAVLFLTALLRGQRYAAQYVRTLLIGYTIALAVFCLLPAKGPYFICPDHQLHYPRTLLSYAVQRELGSDVRMLWTHHLPPGATTGIAYFISFPCMHIALAIISIWFLRRWRRICRMVLVWDAALLAPAILLLEWHYVIGMVGGIATAFLAIWLCGRISRKAGHSTLSQALRKIDAAAAL